jgi:hypothetical protein
MTGSLGSRLKAAVERMRRQREHQPRHFIFKCWPDDLEVF